MDERGNPIQGQRLGIQEYWEHCRGDKRLKYLVRRPYCKGETRLKSIVHTHQPGGDSHSDTVTSQPVPQTTHSGGGSARTRMLAWTSQEDKLACSLEACLSVFRSGLLQDIRVEDLVFCESSNQDDPHFPPPLQSLVMSNTQFLELEYRDWITKMHIDTNNLDCGKFECCWSIRDKLLNDIRNEWIRLDDLKLCAWQMASRNSCAMSSPSYPGPSASDFSSTQVIDTCECVISISVAHYIEI
jgi:hypothetical protein